MRLYTLLKNMINKLARASRKGTIYHTSGVLKALYSQNITLCSLTDLPVGTYLVLGRVGASAGSSTILNANIAHDGESCEYVSGGASRGTMSSGGGTACWYIIRVKKKPGKVFLTSYGYYNGTYNLGGYLAAISLDGGVKQLVKQLLGGVYYG